MTYYLDEDIDISVTGITSITNDGMYTYKVQEKVSGVWTNRFVGNVFLSKGTTAYNFHLNDIVEDWKDKNQLQPSEDVLNINWYSTWRLVLTTDTDYSKEFDIAMIYRYPNRGKVVEPEIKSIDTLTLNIIQGYKRYDRSLVLPPHIPNIQSRYFVFSIYCTQPMEGLPLYFLVDEKLGSTEFTATNSKAGIINVDVDSIFNGVVGTINDGAKIYISDNDANKLYQVGVVDKCPAKYYLLWQDRFGGMQSQPFTGTETYSEDVNQSYTTNYKGYKNVSGVDVQPKWKLNTGWISTELYPYYESIFVSPYLKLYITDTDETIDVVLDDSEYTEKTFKNQGNKLFNLEVNLQKTKSQNIKW